MDLVGPRYIKGDGRLYCLNIIDTQTHWAHIHPMRDKTAESILPGIITLWKSFGIPDCLQMDNELVFRGSNRYPRSLGLILRFILSLGVTPLFIPFSAPWRNGLIERFNFTFKNKFFRAQRFESYEALKKEAIVFVNFHNQHHTYSTQAGKTPLQALKHLGGTPRLDQSYKCTQRPLLESGSILFIRYIRSDLNLTILGSTFKVKKQLMYSYVVAEVIIENHVLIIYQDHQIHHKFTFIMNVDW